MQVQLQNVQIKFVYVGHRVKVKVTGARERLRCLDFRALS